MVGTGKILSVEVLARNDSKYHLEAVRTWGRVESHDVAECKARVSHSDAIITVDTRLVEPVGNILKSKVQIIGELDKGNSEPIIRARLIIPANNLDFQLLEKALIVRQNFIDDYT